MTGRALSPLRVEASLWLLVLGGLAAGIGIETDWGTKLVWPVAAPAVDATPLAKPALAEPFRLPPPDTYLETPMRPIFVVTRRPAPIPPPPEPPKPSMKRGQFQLTGTTILPDGRFAYLLEKAGNKTRVVAQGKEINGITVKEVHADRVVLTQHDDTELLTLVTAKAPALPAGPAVKGTAATPPPPGGRPPKAPGQEEPQ